LDSPEYAKLLSRFHQVLTSRPKLGNFYNPLRFLKFQPRLAVLCDDLFEQLSAGICLRLLWQRKPRTASCICVTKSGREVISIYRTPSFSLGIDPIKAGLSRDFLIDDARLLYRRSSRLTRTFTITAVIKLVVCLQLVPDARVLQIRITMCCLLRQLLRTGSIPRAFVRSAVNGLQRDLRHYPLTPTTGATM